jgi:formylglycine-generating enzyme required for sulfatase activity
VSELRRCLGALGAGRWSLLPPIVALFLAGCAEMPFGQCPAEKQSTGLEGKALTVHVATGLDIGLVYIPPGTFTMGNTDQEVKAVRQKWPQVKEYWVSNEMPAHTVTIRKGFHMGKYEVTQELWEALMGSNPSDPNFLGPKMPVQASWLECKEFIRRLKERTGLRFAFPSEAEWEYACRAGSTTRFYFGEDEGLLQRHGSPRRSLGGVRSVGLKEPNGWGLFDMQGNVSEWCEDIRHDTYEGAPCDGSPWLAGGDGRYRMHRGACWDDNEYNFRSAKRFMVSPDTNSGTTGLRIVLRDWR